MTWGEFKAEVERQGFTDDKEINSIHWDWDQDPVVEKRADVDWCISGEYDEFDDDWMDDIDEDPKEDEE